MASYVFNICKRHLENLTGLKLHQKKCSVIHKKHTIENEIGIENCLETPTLDLTQNSAFAIKESFTSEESPKMKPLEPPDPPEPRSISFKWGSFTNNEVVEMMKIAYEKIVFWRKNLFLLPTGKAEKSFIDEITRLLDAWEQDSPLHSIAFKAIMIMPSLLLQKPSKLSKAKDHIKALERRLILWLNGNIDELLAESEAIQNSLPDANGMKNICDVSKRFAHACVREM